MISRKLLSHFSIIIAGLGIGFIGIFVKMIGESMNAMNVAFFRLLIGFLFLLLIMPFIDKSIFKISWNDFKDYAGIGLLMAAGFSTFIYALQIAPVSNVVLIDKTYVIFVTIFAYIFLREKITCKEVIALLVGIAGLAIINPFQKDYLVGSIFALISAIIFAFQIVYMKYEDKNHHAGAIIWFLLIASIALSPMPVVFGTAGLAENWFWLLMLGVLCTGLTYFMFNYGLKYAKAEDASILMMISSSIFAILLAVVLLGERPGINVIIGGIILIVSGLILESGKKNN